MGLLKHAVIPFNALVNALFFYKFLIAEDYAEIMADWGKDDTPLTPLENHLFHIGGGIGLAFLINSLAAIFVENSHYRMMVCLLQIVIFTVDGYSYVKLDVNINPIIYVIVGVNVVGLLVHSQEPGIFTKDKNSDGKSKKKKWTLPLYGIDEGWQA